MYLRQQLRQPSALATADSFAEVTAPAIETGADDGSVTAKLEPEDRYARKRRRKTRGDRYEFKENHRGRRGHRLAPHRASTTRISQKRAAKDLSDNFTAVNVQAPRLTMSRPYATKLFDQIGASPVQASQDLPDLTFTRMSFLSNFGTGGRETKLRPIDPGDFLHGATNPSQKEVCAPSTYAHRCPRCDQRLQSSCCCRVEGRRSLDDIPSLRRGLASVCDHPNGQRGQIRDLCHEPVLAEGKLCWSELAGPLHPRHRQSACPYVPKSSPNSPRFLTPKNIPRDRVRNDFCSNLIGCETRQSSPLLTISHNDWPSVSSYSASPRLSTRDAKCCQLSQSNGNKRCRVDGFQEPITDSNGAEQHQELGNYQRNIGVAASPKHHRAIEGRQRHDWEALLASNKAQSFSSTCYVIQTPCTGQSVYRNTSPCSLERLARVGCMTPSAYESCFAVDCSQEHSYHHHHKRLCSSALGPGVDYDAKTVESTAPHYSSRSLYSQLDCNSDDPLLRPMYYPQFASQHAEFLTSDAAGSVTSSDPVLTPGFFSLVDIDARDLSLSSIDEEYDERASLGFYSHITEDQSIITTPTIPEFKAAGSPQRREQHSTFEGFCRPYLLF